MRRMILAALIFLSFSPATRATVYQADLAALGNDVLIPINGMGNAELRVTMPNPTIVGWAGLPTFGWEATFNIAVFDADLNTPTFACSFCRIAQQTFDMNGPLDQPGSFELDFKPGDRLLSLAFVEAQEIGVYGPLVVSLNFDDDLLSLPPAFAIASAVPEPSTWTMTILGFCGVSFLAGRRRSLPSRLIFALSNADLRKAA